MFIFSSLNLSRLNHSPCLLTIYTPPLAVFVVSYSYSYMLRFGSCVFCFVAFWVYMYVYVKMLRENVQVRNVRDMSVIVSGAWGPSITVHHSYSLHTRCVETCVK